MEKLTPIWGEKSGGGANHAPLLAAGCTDAI